MSLDLELRLEKLIFFLKEHEDLFDKEFLKKYPSPYPLKIQSWLLEMSSMDDQQIAQMESCPHEDQVNNVSFKDYLKTIRELSQLPKVERSQQCIPPFLKKGLNRKKEHELALLKNLMDQSNKEVIFDIGGGVGHTSFLAVHGTSKKAYCLDQDRVLQTKGQKKKENTEALNKEKVEFIQKKISLGFPIGIKEDSLTIGLHSCGDLGTSLIKELGSKDSCELILFSCCYHKIDQGQNLSLVALKNPIHFSSNALHLASRSGKIITIDDLAKRKRFKRHRYSLHYFLFDQFKLPFRALGNTSPKDYQGAFSKYAKTHTNLASLKGVSEEELDRFYQSDETKNKFVDNFNADIIRLMLGRLIEQYIVIDRALYLKENGHKTSIEEVFDRSLSPRNILLRSHS